MYRHAEHQLINLTVEVNRRSREAHICRYWQHFIMDAYLKEAVWARRVNILLLLITLQQASPPKQLNRSFREAVGRSASATFQPHFSHISRFLNDIH